MQHRSVQNTAKEPAISTNSPLMLNFLLKTLLVAAFGVVLAAKSDAVVDGSPDTDELDPGGGGLGSDGSSGAEYTASVVGYSPQVTSRGSPSSPAVPEYLTVVVVVEPKRYRQG